MKHIITTFLSVGALALVAMGNPADADITMKMTKWSVLPRVVIAEGPSGDCKAVKVIHDGQLFTGYREIFLGTGGNGVDLCFRRTVDPQDPSSPLDITWSRCAADGDCEIR